MKPIGILGGTFDPVHHGHLRIALDAIAALDLDHVRLIPAGDPAHRAAPIASAEHRAAMLSAAITNVPQLVCDTREITRGGPSYTYDTLRELRAEFPDSPLCLLLGTDSFSSLDSWRLWEHLPDFAHIVILQRPGAAVQPAGRVQDWLNTANISDPRFLHQKLAGYAYRYTVTQLDISATCIRQLLDDGDSAHYLLPDSVLNYLETHQLYAS